MVLVFVWSSAVGVAIYRMLGVTISIVNDRPATLTDEILIHGIDGASLAMFLQLLIFLILFIARIPYRFGLVALLLVVFGTPLALLSGWRIADYLWTLNRGGVPWEGSAPQVIALSFTWVIALALDAWMSRYRIVIVRRDDRRKSPCPRCGYDLFGGASGVCTECGWIVPPYLQIKQTD